MAGDLAGDHLERLKEEASSLPDSPGVYIFRGKNGRPIYIGKAASLRSRVRSYFHFPGAAQRGTRDPKMMLSQAASLDYILTDTQLEALILESNLIKKHKPRFNVLLRDDKHYPYIKVSVGEEWPRAVISRSAHKDGSRYFGPYYPASKLHRTLKLARKLFPLRSCSDHAMRNAARPCLRYHIGTCAAPCVKAISREDYALIVKDFCSFLEGKHEAVLKRLRQEMEEAANDLEFEKAAEHRDLIGAIERIAEEQKAISTSLQDHDVLGMALRKRLGAAEEARVRGSVIRFAVREGKMLGCEHRLVDAPDDSSILLEFIKQHYREVHDVPRRILLPAELESSCPREEMNLIESWLSRRKNGAVKLVFPKRGEKRRLVELASRNARAALEAASDAGAEGLEEIGLILGMEAPPHRVECFDVSHHHGVEPVGAMAVMVGGSLDRASYRRFRLDQEGAPLEDDCARLHHVLRRRLKRGLEDPRSGWELPDLILVDGGKPQLGAAVSAVKDAGISIPVLALAKENEEVFVPGRQSPLPLGRDSPALRILQKVRDEAHRLAVGLHRSSRRKSALRSVLDEVPGIGPSRRSTLLRTFGSLNAIREAAVEEIAKAPGISLKLAEAIKRHLNSK